jgi:hypothetical protein
MASKKKIDACRANGAKGAGKKSEASRQKCAANSLKHGLCATAPSSMLLPSEGDQGHHFAAFFQLGFNYGAAAISNWAEIADSSRSIN